MMAAKRARGDRILDLTESNPTKAELVMPEREIIEALAGMRALRYEPVPAGLAWARQAVSGYYGGSVDADRILLTTSTSEAYAYLFKLLTDPGDEVLVPRPSYPLFDFLAGMELVDIAAYSLTYDLNKGDQAHWRIDFDDLTRKASRRTRAVVVVNPNNPTGSFLKRSELHRMFAFC